MTRKDFQLIAETINDLYMGHKNWNRKLDQVTIMFAERLAITNPRFDRQRFINVATGKKEQ